MRQPSWLERAKETYKFHRLHLLDDEKWRLINTSRSLRRSLGGVCQDILIATWCKTHEKQIERFTYMYEALDFIRKKQKELGLQEIE